MNSKIHICNGLQHFPYSHPFLRFFLRAIIYQSVCSPTLFLKVPAKDIAPLIRTKDLARGEI